MTSRPFVCPRCNETHDAVQLTELAGRTVIAWRGHETPPAEYTHWGTCPTTGHPILFRPEPPTESK